MTETSSTASPPLTWYAENFPTFSSIGTAVCILWLLFFIYTRSGSLLFLRDLFWKVFGGKTKFESARFERMRKDLRELEYFRYEFNIPANTLEEADLAEDWMHKHSFNPRDFGRIRNYVDWKDFTNLKFKTKKFANWITTLFLSTSFFLLLYIAITPTLLDVKHLMVSLKNDDKTPSFFLAEDHAKLELFSSKRLTVEKCRSSETLQEFVSPGFPEKKLDTICSFFLDKNYKKYVKEGLSEQRALFTWVAFFSFVGMIWLVVLVARMEVARKLHKQFLAENQKLN